MHKDELILLHQMLVEVKEYIQEHDPKVNFSEYSSLKILPTQTHRSKLEHKYAIFVLGNEIAHAMREIDFSSAARVSARMRELSEKTLKELSAE